MLLKGDHGEHRVMESHCEHQVIEVSQVRAEAEEAMACHGPPPCAWSLRRVCWRGLRGVRAWMGCECVERMRAWQAIGGC